MMLAEEQSTVRQGRNLAGSEAAHTTGVAPGKPFHFEQLRRPLPKSALVLQPETITWARSLPFDVLPKSLLMDFPRIANQLAAAWHSPQLFRQQMQGLLLNDRPGRQGFPFKIVNELADLQAYFNQLRTASRDKEWRSLVVR